MYITRQNVVKEAADNKKMATPRLGSVAEDVK
jgi:hypothetical protein